MGRKGWEDNEDGEDLKEPGGGICEEGLMGASVEEGSNGVRTNWTDILKTIAEGNTDCDKGISSASFERQIGKGIGETCADEPLICLFLNNTPSSFPPDDVPASSSTPPFAKMPHDPPKDPEIPVRKPDIEPMECMSRRGMSSP